MKQYDQLQCSCGWKSQPYPIGAWFASIGGGIACPICTRLRRNKHLEVYGHVRVVMIFEDDLDRVC